MDNLAHALFGSVIGVAIAPKIAKTHKKRLMLASALVVNIPDVDLVLRFFGGNFYHFHHRGFTHSILGLLVMVPLGLFLFRIVMGRAFRQQEGVSFGWKQQVRFVVVQLIVSHYFLDYLTTYGTMFLYPFSFDRFSYPLMFILDPGLWLIGFIGVTFLLLRKRNTEKALRRISLITLLSVILLWGVELTFKEKAESLYQQYATVPTPQIIESYPGFLAPMVWNLLGKDKREERLYHQGIVSFIKPADSQRFVDFPVPDEFHHGKFCNNQEYSPSAHESFRKFLRWGEPVVCQSVSEEGQSFCLCMSLKYSPASWWRATPIGLFRINPDGQNGGFIDSPSSPEDWEPLLSLYNRN